MFHQPAFLYVYSLYKAVWRILELIFIAYSKKNKTSIKFLLFRMKYIIDGVVYLIIWLLYYLIAQMNLFIYSLLNCSSYFFLSIELLFFNVLRKECKEY